MNTNQELKRQTDFIAIAYPGWFYTGIYGSQNYNCAWEGSDVDTKSIVCLPFSDLLQRKNINNSIQTTLGSNDNLADVKDIQSMFGNFLKSNINFLEILCTDYYLQDVSVRVQIEKLRSLADACTYYNFKQLIHAAVGQFRMKYVAMEKEFESKMPLIEKYGYDPKQLASMARLVYTTQNLMQVMPLKQAIDLTKYRDNIISIKSNPPSLKTARKEAAIMSALMDGYIESVKDDPNVGYTSPLTELQTIEEDIYKIYLTRLFIKGKY